MLLVRWTSIGLLENSRDLALTVLRRNPAEIMHLHRPTPGPRPVVLIPQDACLN